MNVFAFVRTELVCVCGWGWVYVCVRVVKVTVSVITPGVYLGTNANPRCCFWFLHDKLECVWASVVAVNLLDCNLTSALLNFHITALYAMLMMSQCKLL